MRALLKDRLRKAFEARLDSIVSAVLSQCLECGADTSHFHHLVPKVRGGVTVVPLCDVCHGKVHDMDFTDHKELTKEGMKKAGLKVISDETYKKICKCLSQGWTFRKISEEFGVGSSTITRAKEMNVSAD